VLIHRHIDVALALLGEVRAMVEKMTTTEEAKIVAPPNALPPLPCLDSPDPSEATMTHINPP
jgi:hypothetical protein